MRRIIPSPNCDCLKCVRVPTRGSNIVGDDGTTPGDGKGAGGLSSEFFAHMKRNWLWTNHLLACKRVRTNAWAGFGALLMRILL